MSNLPLIFSDAYIRSSKGNIPLKVAKFEGKVLIECKKAPALLNHLFDDLNLDPSIKTDQVLRAVFYPDEGLVIELFDTFGRLSEDSMKISTEDANNKFFNSLLWEV